MKKALLFVLLCRCVVAQQSGIEGVATDSVTHQPVAGVHITLGAPMAPSGQSLDTYGAISRRDGHFSVTGMPAAVYFMSAQHNGYIYVPGKEPGVTVKPGEITSLSVELTPQGVISGRVLDENGDPVQHVQVNAIPSVSASAESRFRIPMNARTDDRGQFRVIGAPGKFLLKAMSQGVFMSSPSDDDAAPDGSAYGETYYPATGSKGQATAVTVTAGHETTRIDIRLIRKRTFTISGAVSGMPAIPTPARIWLFSRLDGSDRFNGTTGLEAGRDGKFALHGLAPGRYRVVAKTENLITSPALQSQFVDVTLESSDAANVALTLAQGEALSGVLETAGTQAKGAPVQNTTVRLEPYPPGQTGQPNGGEVAPDGTFRFAELFPGEYLVHVVPLPENAYLKSVNLDGVEMANETLRLSHGIAGAKLKITVSLNGGQVTGKVLDADGHPLPTLALVALAASPDEIRWEHSKPVQAGDSFTFNRVRPGKYRLLAMSPTAMPDENGNFKAFFSKGTEIEVHEGDRIVKDIQPVAAEDPDAKR